MTESTAVRRRHGIRLAAASAAALGASLCLAPGPAAALCSRPIAPYCVSGGTLSGFVAEQACRREVEEHLGELARFEGCLADLLDEIEEEAERLRELLKTAEAPAAPSKS